jgi:putative hydrolase
MHPDPRFRGRAPQVGASGRGVNGPHLLQDHDVHSTWSDGSVVVAENVALADERGLTELTCVDRVRHDTPWVTDFARDVACFADHPRVRVRAAVEGRLLDLGGRLDLPERLPVELVYVADHHVPMAAGPVPPREIRELLSEGEVSRLAVIAGLLEATARSVERPERVVIAHLFRILPKLGLSEDDVPPWLLDRFAVRLARAGAIVEINERWRCPSLRTIQALRRRGVPLCLGSGSREPETLGRYDYGQRVLAALSALSRVAC